MNYDSTNWKKIAEYLNTDNYRKIHAGNRIQLLNTAFHLTAANQLNPTIFLELVDYLQRETDPVVWKSAFILLERIKSNCLQSPRAAEILKVRFTVQISLIEYTFRLIFTSKFQFLTNSFNL